MTTQTMPTPGTRVLTAEALTELNFTASREQAHAYGRIHDWRVTSLIYADWLDDAGREREAAAIRQEVAASEASTPALPTHWPRVDTLAGLTPHQAEHLATALRRPMGILAGSPGTGKTHATAALLRALPQQYSETAVCAPTGKAAVRIGEAMQAAGIRAFGAQTIHQLLGIGRNGHDGQGWGFTANASTPLPQRFIVVEEASMLDVQLAADLLRACKPGAHVLFVGDPDQLPPVGHGAPLRDWINGGIVPVGRLTEVHRNGGKVAEACRLIRAGQQDAAIACASRHNHRQAGAWATSKSATAGDPADNWHHFEASTPGEVLAALRGLLTVCGAAHGGMIPAVQLLAPLRDKGDLSCKSLNTFCQDNLNALSHGVGSETKAWGCRIRTGDRVVCTGNHWAQPRGGGPLLYVANGEVGRVVTTTDGSKGNTIVGAFESPDRDLIMRRGGDGDDNFALGYCLTAHRFQGSEIPVCIVVLDPSARQIVGREWLYTAISRARRLCITVGPLALARQAVGLPKLATRRTFLVDRIAEEVGRGA